MQTVATTQLSIQSGKPWFLHQQPSLIITPWAKPIIQTNPDHCVQYSGMSFPTISFAMEKFPLYNLDSDTITPYPRLLSLDKAGLI